MAISDNDAPTSQEAEEQSEELSISVSIKWPVNDQIPIVFANAFQIQYTPAGEFILTIGQVLPPSDVTTREEFRAIKTVEAKTLCRAGFSADRMGQLIEILQETYGKFTRSVEAKKGDE